MEDAMHFDRSVTTSGMTVYHQYRPVPWFGSMLVVWAGSRHAPVGMEELAHLTEHMLSCGTRGYAYETEADLEYAIDQKEWYFDPGTTDLDHTRAELTAPLRDLDEAMEFLDAFMRRPLLRSGIRRELKIIAAERLRRMSKDEREGSRDRYMAMYNDPHFAAMPSWTDTAPLDDMTMDDVRAFHRKWFECPNMTLVCVGGVAQDALMAVLERRFPVRRKDFIVPACPHVVKFRKPRPRTHIVKKSRGRPHAADINCHWILPPGQGDGLGLVMHCLKTILTTKLRRERETNYEIEIEIEYFRDHRAVRLATSVVPEAAAATRRVIRETLRDPDAIVRDLGFHKHAYRNNLRFIDPSIDDTLAQALESLVACGTIRTNAWYSRAIDSVTPDDVRRWLGWLAPERAFAEIVET